MDNQKREIQTVTKICKKRETKRKGQTEKRDEQKSERNPSPTSLKIGGEQRAVFLV